MSRGLGKMQHRILDELSSGRLSVTEIAERFGVSDRQIRRAVHALADRELVNLMTETTQLADGRWAPVKLFVEKPSPAGRRLQLVKTGASPSATPYYVARDDDPTSLKNILASAPRPGPGTRMTKEQTSEEFRAEQRELLLRKLGNDTRPVDLDRPNDLVRRVGDA